MEDSTGKQTCKLEKPAKPYEGFPLYPHNTKRWAKKVKGRTRFYGPWNDWKGALENFNYAITWHLQGLEPPPKNEGAFAVGDLVNHFLEDREAKVLSGELTRRSWLDYKRTGESMVKHFGKYAAVQDLHASHFSAMRKKLSERLGLVALGNEITRVKVFLNFAYKENFIEHPIKTGASFTKPSNKSLRIAKEAKPSKVFTIEELRTLYHTANEQMKAFMLLGLNCGLGNSDIGQLEFRHIEGNWIRFPRPKTGVKRECPLWKETEKAIKKAKQSKSEMPWVFITKYGTPWHKDQAGPLSAEFRKLCNDCGLQQEGRGFYALRHQFRTVADGCHDQVAVNHIMGHQDTSIAASYREWIEPKRLQAVVDHVYQWVKPMFKKPGKKNVGAE